MKAESCSGKCCSSTGLCQVWSQEPHHVSEFAFCSGDKNGTEQVFPCQEVIGLIQSTT